MHLYRKFSNWFRTVRNTNSTMVEALRTHHAPGFLTRWEHDYKLIEVDQLALFEEYLEMGTTREYESHFHILTVAFDINEVCLHTLAVIQYGFVTLFVAAF